MPGSDAEASRSSVHIGARLHIAKGPSQPKPLLVGMHRAVNDKLHITRSGIQKLVSKVIIGCFTEGGHCDYIQVLSK